MTSAPHNLPLAAIVLLFLAPFAPAIPPSVPEVVPQDCVAAILVDPRTEGEQTFGLGSLGLATALADRAGDLGLLSGIEPQVRAWIDALTGMSALREFPHAIIVFDAQSRKLADGGHRLSGLQAALIVRTAGKHEDLEKRIQRLLNTYTNQNDSTLSERQHTGDSFFHLADRRLEDWLAIEWGSVGDHYVIGVGDDSFARSADAIRGRAPALAQDPWFDNAFGQVQGIRSYLGVLLRFDTVGARSDKTLAYKVRRVQEALQLKGVSKGFWTLRLEDRVVHAAGFIDRGGRSEVQRITDDRLAGTSVEQIVPPQATRFANFDTQPATALALFREAYLSARSPHSRERVFEYWRDLEQRAGISIERQIFGNLGRGVLIHNYPKHALNLPLLCTIVIPIAPRSGGSSTAEEVEADAPLPSGRRSAAPEEGAGADSPLPLGEGSGVRAGGDVQTPQTSGAPVEVTSPSYGQANPAQSPAAELRTAVDKLFTVWQSELAEAISPVSLRRDDSGIWNLFLGIEGPALGLSDRWLVISFSPAAVRQNLEFLSTTNAGIPTSP